MINYLYKKLIFMGSMLCCYHAFAVDITYQLEVDKSVGKNTRFWQAVGHDYLFHYTNTEIGQQFLDRAKERQSITYYRTHFTFNKTCAEKDTPGICVGGDVAKINADGSVSYDFSRVNKTFQNYVNRGMKPIVEFSFYPQGFAKTLADEDKREGDHSRNAQPIDWKQWENLQHAFMQNLETTFGEDELKTWYFEVWNEPDQWPIEHYDVFTRLYDVFSYTVKSYNNEYKVGGAACFTPICMDNFLRHVSYGKNTKTGQIGAPLDFISYHMYGLSGSWLEKSPIMKPRVSTFTHNLRWMNRILKQYPKAQKAEFHLNEWGLSSRFRRTSQQFPELEYRNNHLSALFMTKLVDNMFALNDNKKELNVDLMLYWGFTWEAERGRQFSGNRELLTGGGIGKPILTTYEMLARLQDQRIRVKGYQTGERFGIIATTNTDIQAQQNGKKLSFIVYNYEEADDNLNKVDNISIALSGLIGKSVTWQSYLLDAKHNNSYQLWLDAGQPAINELSDALIEQSNNLQQTNQGQLTINQGESTLDISLKRHSMILIQANIYR
jgi:xylan 1,4-beta-xylosidase